jgi:hypothetical protein
MIITKAYSFVGSRRSSTAEALNTAFEVGHEDLLGSKVDYPRDLFVAHVANNTYMVIGADADTPQEPTHVVDYSHNLAIHVHQPQGRGIVVVDGEERLDSGLVHGDKSRVGDKGQPLSRDAAEAAQRPYG